MSEYISFLLVGLGAGTAYAAIALGLVVTYKGTGVINFAAGAMGAWSCYVYDELRRNGNFLIPLPVNHESTLGEKGSYGGFPLAFFTAASTAMFILLFYVLIVKPMRRRLPSLATAAVALGVVGGVVWTIFVLIHLRAEGQYQLPLIPYRYDIGKVGFFPAFVAAGISAALLGLMVHFLVFRPLRTAPPLAKVVASIGVLTTIQALIVFRFGSVPRAVPNVLPNERLDFAGLNVPRDRVYLALAAIIVAIALWAWFRYTRTGLATRAAAENERAASLARYSPQYLAGTTWIVSSVVTALLLVLTLQVIPLSPTVHTLMIVPALACALVGRLTYVGQTVAAALVLGGLQSIFVFLSSKSWWPTSFRTGLSDAVPFIVLIIVLFVLGKSLPTRGALRADPLPEVIIPRNRLRVIIPLVAIGLVAILATSGSYRYGVITSMMFTVATLSIVLLTGMIGQISLAQAALAGTGGFALSKLADGAGIGFPWSMLLAALIAAAFGVLVGIPALRIRGAQLAVVTLAAAVALERFVFRNPSFTKVAGNPIPDPKLFGVNLGVRQGSNIARWQFGVLVLIVLVLVALAVSNLMRSAVGRRFIAIRSNERAGAAVGINVATNKLLAFGMASFLAGIAGSLIGYSRGQLSADSFATFVNVSFLAFAYLGGITAVSGAIIGGAFAPLGIGFVISDRLLNVGTVYSLIAGLGVILTAIFNPIGIAGANRHTWEAIKARRRARAMLPTQIAVEPAPEDDHPPVITPEAARPEHRRHVRTAAADVRLQTRGLSVSYGGVRAVDEVNLEIQGGEIVGLIGPNGAGKTSFVDGLTGFTAARGTVEFGGRSLDGLAPHARARLGLARTWQAGELFDDLTVRQNLRVAAEPASVMSIVLDVVRPQRPLDQSGVDWALELVGLGTVADERPKNLSLGQQKLLGVARALAARPAVVLLDEPAAGLDSTESGALGQRLYDIVDHDISVFLIDHDMGLVLETCDYIYVLEFGRLIAEGTPREIRNNDAVIEAYLGEAARAAKAKTGALPVAEARRPTSIGAPGTGPLV
jgi:ABC-type branched-subunit amino acid transport system ATPase component/branched-subunit amino acid ABC-type transport system permease component